MIIIRDANIDDAVTIAALSTKARQKAHLGIVPVEVLAEELVTEKRIENFKKRATDNNEIFFVAEENNKILGFLWGGINNNKNIPYPYEIHALYVDIEYQQQGIGRLLIEEFKNRINHQVFSLYMLKGNESRKFYNKLGGEELPEYAISKEMHGWQAPLVMFRFS